MGKTLSQEQKDKLYQILLRNYVLVADSAKLPRCKFMEAEIQLKDQNSAVFQPSYKFDEAEKVIADVTKGVARGLISKMMGRVLTMNNVYSGARGCRAGRFYTLHVSSRTAGPS